MARDLLADDTEPGWTREKLESLVDSAADHYGVPRALARAIVGQESSWDIKASSGKAHGIMQLAPATAAELGVTDIYDPVQNIDGGMRYIRKQLDDFKDPAIALAAYNAGPNAVRRYGGIPPYEETQGYVAKILKKAGNFVMPTAEAEEKAPRDLLASAPTPAPDEPDSDAWDMPKRILGAAGGGLLQGVGGAIEYLGENPILGADPLGIGPSVARGGQAIARFGEGLQPDTSDLGYVGRNVVGGLATAAQMAPATVASVMTGNPAPLLAQAGIVSGGQAYRRAKAAGLDDKAAGRYAVVNGGLEAGMEMIPMKSLLKAGSPFVKRLTDFLAREVPSEVATTVGQDISTKLAGVDPNMTLGDAMRNIGDTIGQVAIAGPVQTGIAHLAQPGATPAPATEAPVAPPPAVTEPLPAAPAVQTAAPVDLLATPVTPAPAPAPRPPLASVDLTAQEALKRPEPPLPENVADEQLGFNWQKIDAPEDVTSLMTNYARKYEGRIDEERRGTIANHYTRAVADMLGEDPAKLMQRKRGEALNAEHLLATHQLLTDAAGRVTQIAQAIRDGDNSPAKLAEFQESMAKYGAIANTFAGARAEAGRALQILKLTTQARKDATYLKEIFETRGAKLEEIAGMVATLETPEQVGAFTRQIQKPTWHDKIYTVWVNGLLSGPVTHLVNTTSNALTQGWSLGETALASTFSRNITRREVVARAYGLVEGVTDGLKAAATTLKTGEAPEFSKTEQRTEGRTFTNPKVDAFWTAPGRLLESEDAFFKTVAYRSELRGLAMRTGLQKGLSGDALATHIADTLTNPPEDLSAEAQNAARYLTFTNKLGDFGQAAMKLRHSHPALGYVIPFIRTPVNITKFALERTPLAPVFSHVREDLKAGGARRDMAIARVAMGSAVGAAVAHLAGQGIITGGGPDDPERRRVWLQSHQPYSVKLGDTWYSYGRLEPIGGIVGMAADFADMVGGLSDKEAEIGAGSVAGAISRNLLSKTFLKGISEFLRAATDYDRYGQNYVATLAGSLVPYSSLVGQVARTMDPVIRETKPRGESVDLFDRLDNAITARIPGKTSLLPPKRDIFGEPIVRESTLSPVATKAASKDKVALELDRLNMQIGQPSDTVGKRKLDAEQYDKHLELSGKQIHKTLSRFIGTKGYERLSDDAKKDLISDLVTQSRKAARARLH